jgi:hypothetical protein
MGSIFGGRFPLDDEAPVPFTERFAFALRLSVAEAKQERDVNGRSERVREGGRE